MQKYLQLIILLLVCTSGFSLTFEKTIPTDSTYMNLSVNKHINNIIYKILSPSYKTQLYPNGLKDSTIEKLMQALEKLEIKEIALFIHNDWNILIKIDSVQMEKIANIFSSLLANEGFMPVINKKGTSGLIISSSIPELAANRFIFKQTKNTILIAMNPFAIDAWETRTLVFPFNDDSFIKENTIATVYGKNNFSAAQQNTLITLEANNAESITIKEIQKGTSKKIEIPTFFKDNPLFFSTTMEPISGSKIDSFKNFFATLYNFIPVLRTPMNIILSHQSGLQSMAFEFLSGDLVSINEKKYSALDMLFAFQFADSKKIEALLKEELKKNRLMDLKIQSSGQQQIFTIFNTKNPDTSPVFLVLNNNGKMVLAFNKSSLLDVANNINNNKSTLIVNNKKNQHLMYIDMISMVERFPILNSLVSQYGVDLKVIKSLTANAPIENTGKYHILSMQLELK